MQAKTLGHADLINTSLALFIKDLFAVVHPAHAARLCGAYIRALRSKEDSPFLVSDKRKKERNKYRGCLIEKKHKKLKKERTSPLRAKDSMLVDSQFRFFSREA